MVTTMMFMMWVEVSHCHKYNQLTYNVVAKLMFQLPTVRFKVLREKLK